MLVVAGLGNPGSRYLYTRHNFGFMVADRFQAVLLKMPENMGRSAEWKQQFDCHYWQAKLKDLDLVLLKPQNFMNRSGQPIKELLDYYKWTSNELLVVHDELDLAFGTIRLKLGGGDGGHNGIKSIVQCLSNREFPRLRMGIGRPATNTDLLSSASGNDITLAVSDWVLGQFPNDQKAKLSDILDKAVEAVIVYCTDGLKKAQNLFNRDFVIINK